MVYKIIIKDWDHYRKVKKKAIIKGYKWLDKEKRELPAAVILFPLNKTVALLKKLKFQCGDFERSYYPNAKVVENLKIRKTSKKGRRIRCVEMDIVFDDINELIKELLKSYSVVYPNKIYSAIKSRKKMYGHHYEYVE